MAIVASTLGGFEDTSKTPPDTAFMTDSERIDHELAYGVVTPKKKGQYSVMNIIMIIMVILGICFAFSIFFLYKFVSAINDVN
jgi:hypothetical protein